MGKDTITVKRKCCHSRPPCKKCPIVVLREALKDAKAAEVKAAKGENDDAGNPVRTSTADAGEAKTGKAKAADVTNGEAPTEDGQRAELKTGADTDDEAKPDAIKTGKDAKNKANNDKNGDGKAGNVTTAEPQKGKTKKEPKKAKKKSKKKKAN